MIKITDGTTIITVSKGAFNNSFKHQGWAEFKPIEVEDTPIKEDDDVMIPLSEMTIAELKGYASHNGIDLNNAKSKKEIIEAIQSERK